MLGKGRGSVSLLIPCHFASFSTETEVDGCRLSSPDYLAQSFHQCKRAKQAAAATSEEEGRRRVRERSLAAREAGRLWEEGDEVVSSECATLD